MRPSTWSEYTMMVAEVTRLAEPEVWERYPLACGRQACALWWQSKRYSTLRPGGSGGSGIDSIV